MIMQASSQQGYNFLAFTLSLWGFNFIIHILMIGMQGPVNARALVKPA